MNPPNCVPSSPSEVLPCPDAAARAALLAPEVLWSSRYVRLLLVQFGYGFSLSCFFLLPKYLQGAFAASASEIGWMTGTAMVTATLGAPLAGRAIDRFGRRRLLLFGMLLMSLGSFAFASVSAPGFAMVALRAAQGLAMVTAFSAAMTLAAEFAPPNRTSEALGYFGLAMLCNNAIAPALIEPLASSYGWKPAFALAGFTSLLGAAVAFTLPDPARPRAAAERSALSLRAPAAVLYLAALTGVGIGVMFTYTQPFALSQGIQRMTPFFVGYTVCAIGVRIGFGSLADRLGRRRTARIVTLAYAAVIASSALLGSSTFLAIGCGLGLTHGVLFPALGALAAERADPEQRGMVLALFTGAFNGGFAASVMLLGPVADAFGYPTLFLLAGALMTTGWWALGR